MVLLHSTGGSGLHPYHPAGAPVTRTSEAVYLRDAPCFSSPFCSALLCHQADTMAYADLLPPACGGVILSDVRQDLREVRRPPFAARPPDLRRLILDHESFAVVCQLALIGTASNPVSVRRPAVSLRASFPRKGRPSAVALRFNRYGQLSGGLAPPRCTSCWSHKRKPPRSAGRLRSYLVVRGGVSARLARPSASAGIARPGWPPGTRRTP